MILTSNVLLLLVESVLTPVIIPLRNPVIEPVVPIPGITSPSIFAVTANPTRAPASNKLFVLIPIVWSAKLSI